MRRGSSCRPNQSLAAGFAPAGQLGLGQLRAQDADRGVQMHQVGAELAEAGVQRLGLAGQLGPVARQRRKDYSTVMFSVRPCCPFSREQ